MHWFICNDARREVAGVNLGGSALRAGRAFVYGARRRLVQLHWHFFADLNWLEARVRLGGEESAIGLSLILPRLVCAGINIAIPKRWLEGWMIEDRTFAVKFGYVGSIAEVEIAWADWAQTCGMTDYYRHQSPRRYTNVQLWPGWHWRLMPPRVLDWIFGRERQEKAAVSMKPIAVELDGRRYEGTWTLERWATTRPRWPWIYGVRLSSWIAMPNPPQFAGKGENSWDCGDDAIYGMGSKATTAAEATGEYVKAVLRYRERYGMPSERECQTA